MAFGLGMAIQECFDLAPNRAYGLFLLGWYRPSEHVLISPPTGHMDYGLLASTASANGFDLAPNRAYGL